MKYVLDASVALKWVLPEIDSEKSIRLQDDFENHQIARTLPLLHPYLPLLPHAIELSSSERVGVYDCLYIALAEREHCKVVSADQRLANTFPSSVIALSGL